MVRMAIGCALILGLAASRAAAESYTTNIVDGVTNSFYSYYVGDTGPFNVLIVTNAGRLALGTAFVVGSNAGASNNSALVTGSGSSVLCNTLTVGRYGAGNQLTISAGGRVDSDLGYLGSYASASNNAVTVSDAGSLWSIATNLYVGYAGAGNNLTLTNSGAVLVASKAYLGYNASANNQIILAGGTLTVTNAGGTGLLDVRYGTLALNGGALDVDVLLATNNTASATNSFVNLNGGTLTTRAGAQIVVPTGTHSVLGATAGQTATWNMLGGTNSVLPVSGPNDTYLGTVSGAVARVTVNGAGTVWTNSGILYVGYSAGADNNQLTISDGGQVWDTKGVIGYDGASATGLVTGANSLWHNAAGLLVVGDHTSGSRLTIANGGVVANGDGHVGYADGANGNAVSVSGAVWTNSGDLYMGRSGAGNQLAITNGGQVVNANGHIGYNAGASNNSVLVSGSGSVWSNRDSLYVGRSGTGNQLAITNGGQVVNANGHIGYNAGASSNSVLVSGSGSVWSSRNSLYVGRSGTGNQLT